MIRCVVKHVFKGEILHKLAFLDSLSTYQAYPPRDMDSEYEPNKGIEELRWDRTEVKKEGNEKMLVAIDRAITHKRT